MSSINVGVKAIAAAAMTLMAVSSAHAACTSLNGGTDAGFCENVKIKLLYATANGDSWVEVDGNPSALACKPNGGVYLKLPASSSNFKLMYSTLLAAHMASRIVNIRLEPAQLAECVVTYITVPN